MHGLDDSFARAKLQYNFLTFVLLPLWEPVVRIFPSMEMYLSSLKSNHDKYQELMDSFKAAE